MSRNGNSNIQGRPTDRDRPLQLRRTEGNREGEEGRSPLLSRKAKTLVISPLVPLALDWQQMLSRSWTHFETLIDFSFRGWGTYRVLCCNRLTEYRWWRQLLFFTRVVLPAVRVAHYRKRERKGGRVRPRLRCKNEAGHRRQTASGRPRPRHSAERRNCLPCTLGQLDNVKR